MKKMTYAQMSNKMSKKLGLLEEDLKSSEPDKRKTAELMIPKIKDGLKALANEQEMMKSEMVNSDMNSSMDRMMSKMEKKWGGDLFKYASGGGLKRSEDYGSKSKPYPSVSSSNFAGGGRSYPIPTKADAIDALRLAGLHGRSDVRTKVFSKYPQLKKEYGGDLPKYQFGSSSSYSFGQNPGTSFAGGTSPTGYDYTSPYSNIDYNNYSSPTTSSYSPFENQSGFGFNQGTRFAGGTTPIGSNYTSIPNTGTMGTSGPTNLPDTSAPTDWNKYSGYGLEAMSLLPSLTKMLPQKKEYYQPTYNPYESEILSRIKQREAGIPESQKLIRESGEYDYSPELKAIQRKYKTAKQIAQENTGAARTLIGLKAGATQASDTSDLFSKLNNWKSQQKYRQALGLDQLGRGYLEGAGLYGDIGAGRAGESKYSKLSNMQLDALQRNMQRQGVAETGEYAQRKSREKYLKDLYKNLYGYQA